MTQTHRILTTAIAALLASATACSDTSTLVSPRSTEQGTATAKDGQASVSGRIHSYPATALADYPTEMSADVGASSDATYEWIFADGSRARGAKITHVFTRKGDEVVKLRITEGTGRTREIVQNMPVTASIVDLGSQLGGIVTGGLHTCAVTGSNALYCWGYNGDGNLGDGTNVDHLVPHLVADTNSYTQIATGLSHSCGLEADSTVSCWGRNRDGQLGDGTTANQSTPTSVSGGVKFKAISVGTAHSCGLDASGNAYCWGSNAFGQLGTGSTGGNETSPVAVSGSHVFSVIRAGYDNTCAIDTNGAAYCWGLDDVGQIGDGSGGVTGTETVNAPTAVAGGLSFSQVDVGWGHACGLTTGNKAYCWGWNKFGQLGAPVLPDSCIGGQACSKVPLAEAGDHSFNAIAVGETHTCALDSNGAAYCWGNNDNGALGLGGAGPEQTTAAMSVVASTSSPFMTQYKSIQSGGAYTCAVGFDNLAYCWGSNISGKLGVGDESVRLVPTVIAGLSFGL
jgi:alpha-tubulin suppressor-like RCC1 family protein